MKTLRFGMISMGLILVTSVLHIAVQRNLVSLLPLPILLSTTLVWVQPAPGYYLLAIIVLGELLGSLPPGVMTILVLTPLLFFRLRRQIHVDISFSFVIILATTITVQLTLLLIAQLWQPLWHTTSWIDFFALIPWQLLAAMLIINTLVAWLLCLAGDALAPRQGQPSSLFDRQRYARPHHS